CYSCPVACSKRYKVKKGKYKGLAGSRIEYGAASIGPITGIFDWPRTLHLKLLCDKYGLDTIELGAVIALTMEGCQRGLLTKDQLFGRTVKFGSVEDAEYIINLIVDRKGIGDILAEGVYRSAIKLGLEDYSFCINKSYTGLQSNNRLVRSLGYLTSTRGGDHLKSFAFTMQNGGYYIAKHIFNIRNVKKQLDKPVDIGRILWWHENYKIIVDSIGVCLFAIQGLPFTGAGYFDDFTEIMNSIYGLDMTEEEVFLAAERIYQVENGFNVCCGLNIDRYIWPERKHDEDINEKLLVDTKISVRDEPGMLPEYFKYRGLTKRGLPSEKRFKELNVNNSVKGLKLRKDDSIYSIKSLMDTVALTVNFNRFDKIYMNLQGFIMDNLIKLKDKLNIRKMKKTEKLDKKAINVEKL
ncbi:MAG TPA: aldehyde ferredoxin oxidoreductase C-terminal domain-containing protein, partial [Tissierellales bacterium]|nr:aldehyde ferredoxin oxidoreductase C-terminal domain-containing protein [Tissierellales bacterium]